MRYIYYRAAHRPGKYPPITEITQPCPINLRIRDSQVPICELMPVFKSLRNITGREKIELLLMIRAVRHILFLSRGSKSIKSVLSVFQIRFKSA